MARRAGSGSFEDQPNYWSKLRSAHHATKGLQLDEEEHDDEGGPLDDERTFCGVRLPSWCGGGAARAENDFKVDDPVELRNLEGSRAMHNQCAGRVVRVADGAFDVKLDSYPHETLTDVAAACLERGKSEGERKLLDRMDALLKDQSGQWNAGAHHVLAAAECRQPSSPTSDFACFKA